MHWPAMATSPSKGRKRSPSSQHKPAQEQWVFSCDALQTDGRCGIYETRPKLCRDFKPGSDPLCVHYGEAEGDSWQGYLVQIKEDAK